MAGTDRRPAGGDGCAPVERRACAARYPRVERWVLGAFVLLVAVTWWRPPWPVEQSLHDAGTVVALGALVVARRRLRLPTSSTLLVLAFLALHTVAARWLYSFVPYDDWSRWLFGRSLSEALGWRRNHFDRLVHLTYGLCVAPVAFECLRRVRRWRPWPAAARAVEIVISTSALYELFEWGLAVMLSAGAAEAYNGQQGDVWDPQKNVLFAVAGAVVAAVGCAGYTARAAYTARGGHTIRAVRAAHVVRAGSGEYPGRRVDGPLSPPRTTRMAEDA